MSQFIHIFCQSDNPIRPQEITEFIEEGSYFDNPPKISLVPVSTKENDARWTEMKIEYKPRKRPVIIHRETRSEEIMEEVEEAIEALESAGLAKQHNELISRMKGTTQLIVFEVDSKGATEDCWEMIDNMEAWLARERNGLIYVSGEGFYDEELETLCNL